jgi:hypothetical protein
MAQPPGVRRRRGAVPESGHLADIYGEMIYTKATAIDGSSLTAEQVEAVTTALYQQELPL